MKYVLFCLLLSFCSCSERIGQTLDPVLKTELVLKAIQNNQHDEIREEIFELDNSLRNKNWLMSTDTIIKNNLDYYGFPKSSQITFYKDPIKANHYRFLRTRDSLDVMVAIAKLGSNQAAIRVAYVKEGNDLKILYYEPEY